MKIKLIVLGKIKEKYLQNGIDEYKKRLSAYCKLEIKEINEIKMSEKASLVEIKNVLDKEALLIEKYLNKDDFIITLDVDGKMLNNKQYVEIISDACLKGSSSFVFIIGSSHGLSDLIKKRANLSWSFSSLVFTHQMIRLMLLEQIYRGFKIINNEPYHK